MINRMTQLTEAPRNTKLKMSYEEYIALPDDIRAEWCDGETIFLERLKHDHQSALEFLLILIRTYVDALELGSVGLGPFEVRLSPNGPSRLPDLFFAATASLPCWTEDRFEGGPDLVIEVISPESIGRDRGIKFYEYQEVGVREYWIIDSRAGKERADFYVLDDTGRFQPTLPDAEGRYHSRVIDGFFVDLNWLWQDPAPSMFAVMPLLAATNPALAEALGRIGNA